MFINVFGCGKTCNFCKSTQYFDERKFIFLNHVANEFQQTQMVYERFIQNIPVLQKHKRFKKHA
ncbi:hypothetical protein Hanom_Chr00s000164g01626131 [Helianthus anomalus]